MADDLGLVLLVRPVLVRLLLLALLQGGQHHDHLHSLLQDKPPEVLEGVLSRSLGSDVGLLHTLEMNLGSIDVGSGRVS